MGISELPPLERGPALLGLAGGYLILKVPT